MKKLSFAIGMGVIMMMISASLSAQIQSTTTGGSWNDPATWVGATIPQAGHDVIINGPVFCENNECNNLIISASGILRNNYVSYSLTVYGNLTNNGTIQNYASAFYLSIKGNIMNEGTWSNYNVTLSGNNDQVITTIGDHAFQCTYFIGVKPSGTVIFDGIVKFNGVLIQFPTDNKTVTIYPNTSLSMLNCTLEGAELNGSGETSKILSEGTYSSATVIINSLSLTDLALEGELNIADCNTYGTIYNNGIIQNNYYSYTMTFYGDFINNGIVRNHPTGSGFSIYLEGNVTNNGSMVNHNIFFSGSGNQNLTCSATHPFAPYQIHNGKSGGQLVALSDFYLQNCQLFMNEQMLILQNGGKISVNGGGVTDAYIQGNESKSGNIKIYMTNGAYLNYCELTNPEILGLAKGFENTFHGNILITDTLQNDYYSNTFTIMGNITNNGLIRNDPSGGALTLKLYGNVINNGIWNNHTMDFYGTTNQAISLMDGKVFSPYYFTDFKPSGRINALTDLSFEFTYINLQNDTLLMPANSTLTLHDFYLQNGFIMPASSRFNLFMKHGARILDCKFYNADLYGTINCQTNTFNGTTINNGTIQNDYVTFTVNFYGNLINNGTIKNNSGGFITNILYGDITNNGIWTNYYTQLIGYSDQHIYLKNEHWIDGQMRFISNVAASPYQWYLNDIAIVDPPLPQAPPFSGWDSNTLVFNDPVSNSWLGTYNCIAGGSYSRNIIISEVSSLQLDITAFLEGPFNGTAMNSDLNSIISLQQSLNIIGYKGLESVPAIPNTNVVDWIGVELRDATDINSATSETTIGGGAYFILNDGSIVKLDGSSLPSFDFTVNNQLFVVLWHRNHLPVISQFPLNETGGIYSYNFTTAASQAFFNNQSDLGGGIYGMIGGNANADGIINEYDGLEAWIPQAGHTGYLQGDVNMDRQVNNLDKNDVWFPNYGKVEKLPGISSCGAAIIDSRDGQTYNTVQIGNQCWMAENLNIGTRIDGTAEQTDNAILEKYCYNDSESNCDTYGGLYQWNEMMQYVTGPGVQGICPTGWHIPDDSEWTVLTVFLGGEFVAGGKMKSTGTIEEGTGLWHAPNTGATNESGFTALPAGERFDDGLFYDLGYYPFFWSSEETYDPSVSWSRYLFTNSTSIYRINYDRAYGLSVRCIKD